MYRKLSAEEERLLRIRQQARDAETKIIDNPEMSEAEIVERVQLIDKLRQESGKRGRFMKDDRKRDVRFLMVPLVPRAFAGKRFTLRYRQWRYLEAYLRDVMGITMLGDLETYFTSASSWIAGNSAIRRGRFNRQFLLRPVLANKIAEQLDEEIASGRTEQAVVRFKKKVEGIRYMKCGRGCKGEGKIDLFGNPACQRCKGTGRRDRYPDGFPFSVGLVKRFAEFCRTSRGFRIWRI